MHSDVARVMLRALFVNLHQQFSFNIDSASVELGMVVGQKFIFVAQFIYLDNTTHRNFTVTYFPGTTVRCNGNYVSNKICCNNVRSIVQICTRGLHSFTDGSASSQLKLT
jgi:hypothetical protein